MQKIVQQLLSFKRHFLKALKTNARFYRIILINALFWLGIAIKLT